MEWMDGCLVDSKHGSYVKIWWTSSNSQPTIKELVGLGVTGVTKTASNRKPPTWKFNKKTSIYFLSEPPTKNTKNPWTQNLQWKKTCTSWKIVHNCGRNYGFRPEHHPFFFERKHHMNHFNPFHRIPAIHVNGWWVFPQPNWKKYANNHEIGNHEPPRLGSG